MPFLRTNIRLHARNYIGLRTYFVTICCFCRKSHFTDLSYGNLVLSHLISYSTSYAFLLHAYCLMPDHLHFLAGGIAPTSDFLAYVTAFKQHTAIAHKQRSAEPLWQAKFYDHILRDVDHSQAVALYIWANPLRKSLCTDPASYPLSGSQSIDWKQRAILFPHWHPAWKESTSP